MEIPAYSSSAVVAFHCLADFTRRDDVVVKFKPLRCMQVQIRGRRYYGSRYLFLRKSNVALESKVYVRAIKHEEMGLLFLRPLKTLLVLA